MEELIFKWIVIIVVGLILINAIYSLIYNLIKKIKGEEDNEVFSCIYRFLLLYLIGVCLIIEVGTIF